jgi:hypothetical protein
MEHNLMMMKWKDQRNQEDQELNMDGLNNIEIENVNVRENVR